MSQQVKCLKIATSGQQLSSMLAICGGDFSRLLWKSNMMAELESYRVSDSTAHTAVTNGCMAFKDTSERTPQGMFSSSPRLPVMPPGGRRVWVKLAGCKFCFQHRQVRNSWLYAGLNASSFAVYLAKLALFFGASVQPAKKRDSNSSPTEELWSLTPGGKKRNV